MIYFDNAATTFPKPEETMRAMQRYMTETGGSPGRSGHRLSIDAGRIIFDAREALAGLFNVSDPLRIALTKNATEALNIVICGLLKPGDHVITSSMEHNSVMRPLRAVEARGYNALPVYGYPTERAIEQFFIDDAGRSRIASLLARSLKTPKLQSVSFSGYVMHVVVQVNDLEWVQNIKFILCMRNNIFL